MDRIGYGPFQRKILIAAGLCSASDAMEILILRFLSAAVQEEWNLTSTQAATLLSSVFVGAFGGTLILGRLGDMYGRRGTFVITAGIVATFGLLSAACPSYGYLLLTRTLVGVGIGGVTVPFDTYAECLPKDCRGKGLVAPSYFWTLGTILVIVGARVTVQNWRLLCLWCAIPCLIATIVGYLVVPESPHWLLAHAPSQSDSTTLEELPVQSSKQQQALTILRRAAKQNGKDPDSILPANARLVTTTTPNHDEIIGDNYVIPSTTSSSTMGDLFAPVRRRVTVSILLVWFGYALLYYGTILITTQVFSTSNHQTNGIQFDYAAILFASLAEVVGATFMSLTIDRWGRRTLHALSFGMGGIFVLGLCLLSSSTVSSSSSSSRSWTMALAFLSRFWIFCGSSVTWIWTAEVMETQHRTTGHSIANAAGRMGGFLAPYLISPSTVHSMGWILWVTSWLLVGIAWSFLPETSGRPLGDASMTTTITTATTQHSLELRPERSTRTKKEYQALSSSSSLMFVDNEEEGDGSEKETIMT